MRKSINKELDALTIAINNAYSEWEGRYVYNQSEDPIEDEEYVTYLIRQGYLTLLCFLEINNFKYLCDYLRIKWEKHEKELLASYISSVTLEPALRVTDTLYEVLGSVRTLVGANSSQNYYNKEISIPKILEAIPQVAYSLGYSINKEADLDKIAEAILLPLFPDLSSHPSLPLADSYRQPDSAIQSINTLIEYKFIKDKSLKRKIIDEIQADIRNYYQLPWENLVFAVGQSDDYINKEKLEGIILKEPSSFKTIEITLFKTTTKKI